VKVSNETRDEQSGRRTSKRASQHEEARLRSSVEGAGLGLRRRRGEQIDSDRGRADQGRV
jgi:hypothetical protein